MPRTNRSAMSSPLNAADYATRLLQALQQPLLAALQAPSEHPAIGWARSGLMALTGAADGEPRMCAAPLTVCADGALAALAALTPAGTFDDWRGRDLLAERAALAGHVRQGTISPGGSCRLLRTADGWLALNLAREEDWALMPAWLETAAPADWDALAAVLRRRSLDGLVERAQELGLAAADAQAAPEARDWFTRISAHASNVPAHAPLVLDLSSLWAGPLCAQLLQRCGARVIKVESLQRADGARQGPRAFFDRINAGKQSLALDLRQATARAQLRTLLAQADIVIESARPRALRQMGIHAEEILCARPGQVWIAISGYGRAATEENRIAYGDDAAVAAGLSRQMFEACGEWMIVGDAIADPLTGLHAALCAWSAWSRGAGGLYALALRDVVAHCLHADAPASDEALRQRHAEWTRLAAQAGGATAPRAPVATQAASELGADTPALRREFSLD